MVPGFREVWKAYEVCRRRKRSRPDAIRFEMRALDETWALTFRLASGRYVPSRAVCFVANESKPREVFAAAFRDRVVHHLVVSALEPFFERRFIADSYACRRKKGTHRAVERLSHFLRAATDNGRVRAYVLTLDIQNFVPSMDKNVLWRVIEDNARFFEHPHRDALLGILKAVLFHDPTRDFVLACPKEDLQRVPAHKRLGALGPERGLPIGNLTSQFLANVLLNELDRFVKHELKVRWYVRYVDDLVLVDRDPGTLQRWASQIEAFLRERLALSLNPDATEVVPASRGVDFLGYIVRPHYRLVRRRVIGNLWRRLQALERLLVRREHGLVCLDFAAAREHGLVSMLASYLGHFRHARSYRTVQRILAAFSWLCEFVRVVRDRKGHLVAREVFKPPRSFPCLRRQWFFFRHLLGGDGPLRENERPVLFVRIGRYYEMFEDDARWAIEALGLRPLEPRSGFAARCGFRKEHLDLFVRRALDAGRGVGILEETGRTLGRVQERRISKFYRREDHEKRTDWACISGGVPRSEGHDGR